MQTNKVIGVLVGVILILIMGKLGLDQLSQKSPEQDLYQSWWSTPNPAEVTKISIHKDSQSLVLTKNNSSWKVADYAADTAAIDQWLPLLIQPVNPEIVAETNVNHTSLGIASSSAVMTVSVNGNDKKIVIGSSAVGGRYIKLDGSDVVYLIKDLPFNIDSTEASDWVDKTLVRLDQQALKTLTWVKGDQKILITKTDGQWHHNDQLLDTTPINPVITNLESLSTQGLVSPDQGHTLPANPSFTLTVERENQDPVILQFFQTEELKAVSLQSQSGVYQLEEATYDQFDLEPSDLIVKSNS